MKRASFVLAGLLLLALSGCAELAGAAIDAGFRKAFDSGKHPLYEHKTYGEHFVDAFVEEETGTKTEVEEPHPTHYHHGRHQ